MKLPARIPAPRFVAGALALLLCLAAGMPQPGGAAHLQGVPPPDIQKILDRGRLVVGIFSKDRPPFFMTGPGGKLSGLDISLAEDIASQLGVEVEFNRRALSFNELCEMVARGDVDVVISKLSRTMERQKLVKFSRPYLQLKQALIVNRMAAVKLKIEDYPMSYLRTARVRVGALEGTSFMQYAAEMFPAAEIVPFPSWSEAVKAVRSGDIIAALYDDNEVIRLVRQNPDVALYVSIYILRDKRDYIAMAVAWESMHFLDWLNTYLETYTEEMDVYDLIGDYPEVYREPQTEGP